MTDERLSTWLFLREAADHRARSRALTRELSEWLPRATRLRVLDLGTGTGSNLRFLAPLLPAPQDWLVVDQSASLLDELADRMRQGPFPVAIETRCQDLGTLGADLFAGRHLVTASALLDLVSEAWLRELAERCRQNQSAVLFALTYNGDSSCTPLEPGDDLVRELLNRHQKRDKGFGVSVGPDAVDHAVQAFEEAGYTVRREQTDWQLTPSAREMQTVLIEGWAEAALELRPDLGSTIRHWLARRLEHVSAGRSSIIVCHEDIVAWLETGRGPSLR